MKIIFARHDRGKGGKGRNQIFPKRIRKKRKEKKREKTRRRLLGEKRIGKGKDRLRDRVEKSNVKISIREIHYD